MQKNKINMTENIFFSLFILFFCNSIFLSCVSGKFSAENITSDALQNIYIEYQNIADTFASQEKYDKAVIYYKLALENKDTYWNVYYKLARTYVMQKSWTDAENMFITLLRRDPNNSTLKESLAYIYSMNGSINEAKEIYIDLITLFPEEKKYLENYISILITEENFDEMFDYNNKLKEVFPDSDKISIFDKEYEKYLQKQAELNPEKTTEESENNHGNLITENEDTNKNPENSNLEIESLDDDEK